VFCGHVAGSLDRGKAPVRHRAATMERIRRSDDVSRPGEGCSVGRVLLGAPVQEVLPDIEDEGCDRTDGDKAAREDDQDLPALGRAAISC
jgi:hypothetical protein